MSNQAVSRDALLQLLDSLDKICTKRIGNSRLTDDDQLRTFISTVQTSLNEYAYRNSMPQLALIAARLPHKVNLLRIPFAVQVVYYVLIGVFLIGSFGGLGELLVLFFPVIVLLVLAHFVVTIVFSRTRRTQLLQICNVVDEAKISLEDSVI